MGNALIALNKQLTSGFLFANSLLIYLIIYAIICFIVSVVMWMLLPERFRGPKWYLIATYFSFSLFIPILGIIGCIAGTILYHRFARNYKVMDIESADYPEFKQEKHVQHKTYGAGGALVRLSPEFDLSERKQSLRTINASPSNETNKINYQLLHDANDELRLYAFSIIDMQEKETNNLISDALDKRKTVQTEQQRAIVDKQLALLHWNLVYQNLMQNGLSKEVTEKSVYYANEALKHLPQDGILWALLGQIHLRKNDLDRAFESLKRALECNIPYNRVGPYLAEISYKKRDFPKVRAYLSASDTLKDIPKLNPIVKFWCDK